MKAGRFTLKAASNQLFVKAIPGGDGLVERLVDFCVVIEKRAQVASLIIWYLVFKNTVETPEL